MGLSTQDVGKVKREERIKLYGNVLERLGGEG